MTNKRIFLRTALILPYFIHAADNTISTNHLQQSLVRACKADDCDRVYSLIQAGADPLCIYSNGGSLAHIAVQNNAQHTIILLKEKTSLDFDAYSNTRETPLSLAIRTNTPESNHIAQLLIKQGAQIDKRATTVMWTPLMIASRLENTTIISSLLEHNAKPYETTSSNHNALSLAYRHKCPLAAKILLARHPDLKTARPPLQYILAPEKTLTILTDEQLAPFLQLLNEYKIDAHAPITIENETHPAITHIVAHPGTTEMLKLFLSHNIAPSKHLMTTLFDTVVKYTSKEAIEKLTLCLMHNKEILYKKDETFLIAAARRSASIAQAIASRCPQYLNFVDRKGNTALHRLLKANHPLAHAHDCIDVLSPLIHRKNNSGATALMLAPSPGLAAHLIALGADIDAQDLKGYTALRRNIGLLNADLVSLLLFAGAQQMPDFEGRSPKEAAQANEPLFRVLHLILFSDLPAGLRKAVEKLRQIEDPMPKIHAITSMLDNPEQTIEKQDNAILFKNLLHTNNRRITRRESEPRKYNRFKSRKPQILS